MALSAMPMPGLAPLLAVAAVGWIYARRIRRQFGHQPYRPRRTTARLVLLSLAMLGLLMAARIVPGAGPAIAAGLLGGIALGWLGLRHTRFETIDGVPGHTPNPWIGGALSLLLLARLAWRWGSGGLATAAASGAPAGFRQGSPLTFGLAAALVAYFLFHGIGLAWRMRHMPAAD